MQRRVLLGVPVSQTGCVHGSSHRALLPGDGMTAALKKMPCTKEWDECIGKDANTGTPAGCACLEGSDDQHAHLGVRLDQQVVLFGDVRSPR